MKVMSLKKCPHDDCGKGCLGLERRNIFEDINMLVVVTLTEKARLRLEGGETLHQERWKLKANNKVTWI